MGFAILWQPCLRQCWDTLCNGFITWDTDMWITCLSSYRIYPIVPELLFFRHLPAHLLHFLESTIALGILVSLLISLSVPRNSTWRSNICQSGLSCFHPFIHPTFPFSFTSLHLFMFLPFLSCLDPQSVVYASFSPSCFLCFCLLASFLLPLYFCYPLGVLQEAVTQKFSNKIRSPEQSKGMGNKCKDEIQEGHYVAMPQWSFTFKEGGKLAQGRQPSQFVWGMSMEWYLEVDSMVHRGQRVHRRLPLWDRFPSHD